MKSSTLIAAAGLLLGVPVAGFAVSSLPAEEAPRSPLRSRFETLGHDDRAQRETALSDIRRWREDLVAMIVPNIERLSANPDPSAGSELDVCLRAAMSYRVVEAVPALVKIVDFRLDAKTFGSGECPGQEHLHPAARALVQIGDRSMVRLLLGRLAETDSKAVVRTSVWVLQQSLGKGDAARLLDGAIASHERKETKERFASARALVDEDGLLSY